MEKLIAAALLVIVCFSCNTSTTKDYPNPTGYDFSQPVRYKMPEELLEISGIAFRNGKSDTVFAVQDEEGRVYRFNLEDSNPMETRFAKKGDFEDVAIFGNRIVILKSNGTLYTFPVTETGNKKTDSAQEYTNILPGGEYEGMYADEKQHTVSVVCKHCNGDKPTQQVTVYQVDVQEDGALKSNGSVVIDVKQIEKITGDNKVRFEPSALAKSPVTQQWFILSAVNNMLVIADNSWQVKEVIKLNPKTFLQPEGMAFDKDGNLYISNEGDELTNGNILLFKYIKP